MTGTDHHNNYHNDNINIMQPATRQQPQDNHKTYIRLPVNLFLYGTLADPHVLAYFAHLPSLPLLTDASISGYKLMRWEGGGGVGGNDSDSDSSSHTQHPGHPTIVPGNHDTDVVHGKVWVCHTAERFRLLQRYMTSMYSHAPCGIEVHNGPAVGRVVPGRTFCWPVSRAQDALVPARRAGRWDLAEYRSSETYRMIREAMLWADTTGVEARCLNRRQEKPIRLEISRG